MSSVFRFADAEPIEASGAWTLADQIDEVCLWLMTDGNAAKVRGAILDIGFNSRFGPRVVVQGEMIPRHFLKKLAELDVELWLSIYPPFAGSPGNPADNE